LDVAVKEIHQIYLNLTPFLYGVFVFKFPFFKRGGIFAFL